MISIKNYIFFLLIICLCTPAYTQSEQDLLKARSEYEKYKNQEAQTPVRTIENVNPITGAPREANVYPYIPLKLSSLDTLNKRSKHFGYDFFTRRDSIGFWENLPTPANYLLGPGDELVISLWGQTQLRETYVITREGTIYDEKVGLLNLVGKTMSDAREYLETQYGRVYATLNGKPQSTFMDVSLGGLRSINVDFVGQVKYPGVYPIHPFSTVITALIQAGGVDTTGTLRSIQLKRNGQIKTNVDLYDYLLKGDLSSNIQLRDQDIIVVPTRASVITVDSAIVNDGIYESVPGETVHDIIQYAGGRTHDASDIVGVRSIRPKKERGNGNIYNASYNNIEETKRMLVNNGDYISIRYLFYELQEVELIGQVKSPGKYHYYKDMTFNDLIKLGGGFEDSTFWKSVYHDKAEIIRRSPVSRYDEVIPVNLNHIFLREKDVPIQNLDRVVIHANSNYFEKDHIQIQGEVNVPGSYPLIYDNETLQSVLNRSGDLTSKAMKNGISIYRDKRYFEATEVQEAFLPERSGITNYEKNANAKVRVAWQNVSIPLMPGDSIVVKESPGTVNVSGEVYNPGLIEFRKGKKLKYYINASGGMTEKANNKKIIVIYANGLVSPNKWYSTPKIEDGTTIIVNKKEITEPFNPTEFASTIASFLSSIITILVLAKQL